MLKLVNRGGKDSVYRWPVSAKTAFRIVHFKESILEKLPEVKCLRDLIPVSHGMALEKGWYDGLASPKDRRADEIWNNFHSEISEAWEEYRANRLRVWMKLEDGRVIEYDDSHVFVDGEGNVDHPGCKPEGFAVEVADLLIRIADTMGALGLEASVPPDWLIEEMPEMDHQKLISGLHFSVTQPLVETNKIDNDGFADVATAVAEMANKFFGKDLFWQVVNLKLKYNATRGWKHGGKLA